MATTEKVKHTPGPWKFVPERLHQGKYHVGGRGPNVQIGDCYRIVIPPGGSIGEANARLIAAAPELAEALRYLLEIREVRCLHKFTKIGRQDEICASCKAESALKKAGLL